MPVEHTFITKDGPKTKKLTGMMDELVENLILKFKRENMIRLFDCTSNETVPIVNYEIMIVQKFMVGLIRLLIFRQGLRNIVLSTVRN
jgi:hypothetical protein